MSKTHQYSQSIKSHQTHLSKHISTPSKQFFALQHRKTSSKSEINSPEITLEDNSCVIHNIQDFPLPLELINQRLLELSDMKSNEESIHEKKPEKKSEKN